jgi:hypothetical protein
VAVVLVHRRHEGTRGEPEPRLHLRDGVETIDQRLLEELVWRVSEDLRVEDQVADPVRLLDEKAGGSPVIGVLRHEAAPLRIDQDPFQHVGGRIERRGEKCAVETDRLAPRRDAEEDSRSVVVVGAVLYQVARHPGELPLEHPVVHDVTAGGQHHAAAGPHVAVLAEVAVTHADHAAGVVRDQRDGPHIAADAGAEFRPGTDQHLHQQRPGLDARHRDLMTPRRRPCALAIGPDLLVAGPDQALRRVLDGRLVRKVAALEGHTERLEPLEVSDAVVAVSPDLGGIRVRRKRHEIPVHLLRAVIEAARFLHRRSAAQVQVTAGDCRSTTATACTFEHQHVGAAASRLDRGAGARRAQPDDHHVGFVGPASHVSCTKECGGLEIVVHTGLGILSGR